MKTRNTSITNIQFNICYLTVRPEISAEWNVDFLIILLLWRKAFFNVFVKKKLFVQYLQSCIENGLFIPQKIERKWTFHLNSICFQIIVSVWIYMGNGWFKYSYHKNNYRGIITYCHIFKGSDETMNLIIEKLIFLKLLKRRNISIHKVMEFLWWYLYHCWIYLFNPYRLFVKWLLSQYGSISTLFQWTSTNSELINFEFIR